MFIGFYAIIWVIFSFLYWVVAFIRGDLGKACSDPQSLDKIVAYWQAQQLFMDNFVKLAKANDTDKINFMQVARDRRIASIVMNSMSVAGVFNGKYEKYKNILRSKSYSQTVLCTTLFEA